jgi:hypothetical protein
MDLNAYVENFDFLYRLSFLESFNGSLKTIDDKKLDGIRKLRDAHIKKYSSQEPKFNVERYLQYQKMLLELNKNKFGQKIRISRIAETKWRSIIEDSIMLDDIDNVKNKLIEISKMPLSERKKIGSEEEIIFVNTNIKNSYQILGIKLYLDDEKDLIRDTRYISNIVGQYGNKLYRELFTHDGYTLPIVGPNGRQIAVVEYQNEHYDELCEHNIRHIKENISKNNTIFDAYYNSSFTTEEKLEYLEDKLCDFMFLNEQKKTTFDIRKRAMQKRVENTIYARMTSIYHRNFNLLGRFVDKDISVTNILLEEGTINSIKKYFDEVSKEERWNEEEKLLCEKELLEYIKLNDKKNRLTNIKSFISILREYMESDEYLKEVLCAIDKEDVEPMFLPEIDRLISHFMLDDSQKEFAKNYMLYLQENKKKEQEDYLDNLSREEEALSCDGYNQVHYWYNMTEDEDKTLKQLFDEGIISYKDYINASRYEEVMNEIFRLGNLPTPTDIARIEKYYDLMSIIDELSTADLSEIKEQLSITNEHINRFDKFCDYLIYSITGKYPEWILLELAKRPKIEKELKNIVHTTYSPKIKIHRKKFSKLSTNPFEF